MFFFYRERVKNLTVSMILAEKGWEVKEFGRMQFTHNLYLLTDDLGFI